MKCVHSLGTEALKSMKKFKCPCCGEGYVQYCPEDVEQDRDSLKKRVTELEGLLGDALDLSKTVLTDGCKCFNKDETAKLKERIEEYLKY